MGKFEEYENYDALGLAELIAMKKVSAAEVLDATLLRVQRLNSSLNCLVNMGKLTLQSWENGSPRGPFDGVPFVLKDLGLLINGTVTTFGSRLFANSIADHDSEVASRYKRAGLVIIGKSNTSEMGLVATTEPALFGPTRNPWDITRSAGGSSGGSAAAVASGIVPAAHATDGGGSIRIPASCCGLFGLKVTRGRTSLAPEAGERNGGFFTHHAVTRSVRDSAALLDVAAGPALGDPYWAPPLARPLLSEVGAPVGKLRIALQNKVGNGAVVAPECIRAVQSAARLCEDLGHTVTEVTPPYDLDALLDSARVIWSASLAAAIDGWCERADRSISPAMVEPFTWHFYQLGRSLQASQYVTAIGRVHAQGRSVSEFFKTYDMLLSPTLASEPIALGNLDTSSVASIGDAHELFLRQFRYSPFTVIANATGTPAMSVPLEWSASRLPIGIHLLAPFGQEALLVRFAAQLEEAKPWFHRRPPCAAMSPSE